MFPDPGFLVLYPKPNPPNATRHSTLRQFEELYSLADEWSTVLQQVMYLNISDYFSYLNRTQLLLYVISLVILLLCFLQGGRVILNQMHRRLISTKQIMSLIDKSILLENSYFQNYLRKMIKQQQE